MFYSINFKITFNFVAGVPPGIIGLAVNAVNIIYILYLNNIL